MAVAAFWAEELEKLMRLATLTLLGAAMLAGCERPEPTRPLTADEAAAAAAAAALRPGTIGPARPPETPWKPMEPLPTETEQARVQAEDSKRELDRRAATLGADIAGATQQADEAFRKAARPEPAPREPAAPQDPPTTPSAPSEPARGTPAG